MTALRIVEIEIPDLGEPHPLLATYARWVRLEAVAIRAERSARHAFRRTIHEESDADIYTIDRAEERVDAMVRLAARAKAAASTAYAAWDAAGRPIRAEAS